MFGKKRTVYLRIYPNELRLKCIEESRVSELVANPPFSNQRLLIAEFDMAEMLFKEGLDALFGQEWQQIRLRYLVQPMAMLVGGLASIELEILERLATAGRAKKVVVHTGRTLSNQQVLKFFDG